MGVDGYVYKIEIAGTKIDETYILPQPLDEEKVKHLFLGHMKEQGAVRRRLARLYSDSVKVTLLSDVDAEEQVRRGATRLTEEQIHKQLYGDTK